ncbi:MAG: hypothetical protein AMJ93_10355 [Anaerolineae bacterium SM23_84]|nr:MAG: hypothetical protein AMJ93_10355 [Anaerolineae bacterium SM23_84]
MEALAIRAAVGRFYTSLVEPPKQADAHTDRCQSPHFHPVEEWDSERICAHDAGTGKMATSRPAQAGTGCSAQADAPQV